MYYKMNMSDKELKKCVVEWLERKPTKEALRQNPHFVADFYWQKFAPLYYDENENDIEEKEAQFFDVVPKTVQEWQRNVAGLREI